MKEIVRLCLLFSIAFLFSGCAKTEDSFEKNDVTVCGIDDPLQNIEWLKKYCESLSGTNDFSTVSIELYKTIDKDEYLFFVTSSMENQYAKSTKLDCMNCRGDTIFRFGWMEGKGDFLPMHPDPAPYDEFMKDKEFVEKIYHYIKQQNK